MKKEQTVIIHGDEWKFEHVIEEIEECKKSNWKKQKWSPSPSLEDKSGQKSSKYTGQKFNPDHTKYVKNGWDHDHCEICWWTMHKSKDEESNSGYTNGYNWVCCECYEQFIK